MTHVDRSKRPGYAKPQPWTTRYDENRAKYGQDLKPAPTTKGRKL